MASRNFYSGGMCRRVTYIRPRASWLLLLPLSFLPMVTKTTTFLRTTEAFRSPATDSVEPMPTCPPPMQGGRHRIQL